MTLSLSHPQLAAALADVAPVEAVTDWLADQNATLANVLVLYAGTAPVHANGLPKPILECWLDHHLQVLIGTGRKGTCVLAADAVRALTLEQYEGPPRRSPHPADAELELPAWRRLSHTLYAGARRRLTGGIGDREGVDLQVQSVWCLIKLGIAPLDELIPGPPEILPEVVVAVDEELAAARRDLKRRVLALFPEVRCYSPVLRGDVLAPRLILPDVLVIEPGGLGAYEAPKDIEAVGGAVVPGAMAGYGQT